jgi:ABC-2 type transport system ATP-binding protein
MREAFRVEVRDVVKRFDTFVAVDHVTFSLRSGEIVAMLGPNGAGKTTMIRMMVGLLSRDHGVIRIGGMDPLKSPRKVRREVGYMPQILSLYQELRVGELLDIFASFYGLSPSRRGARVRKLAENFQLNPWWHRSVGNLPRGVQQRVGLSLALLADPPILLLDEPTSGVDPAMRRRFWDLLRQYRDKGKTLLVTTHDLREAEQADRILTLYRGRVVADGTLSELRAQTPCRVLRLSETTLERLQNHELPGVVLPRGRWVDVVIHQKYQDAWNRWLQSENLQGVPVRPDLEHLFVLWIRS